MPPPWTPPISTSAWVQRRRRPPERGRPRFPAGPPKPKPSCGALSEAFDALDAQDGRILARLELARALRHRPPGRQEAIRLLESALEIVEAARSDLRLPSFRATFLGGWQAVYQELVDLLASAAVEAAREGLPARASSMAQRALAVAERARARALLDRMAAAESFERYPAAGPPGPWQGLRGQVETLEAQALLQASTASRGRGGAPTQAPAALEARARLRQARSALERAQEVSQQAGPPSPVATPASIGKIRRQLDAETILLVYFLAPQRSWVWRVGLEGAEVLPLPPAAEVEAAARSVHRLLPLYHRAGYGKAARQALDSLAGLVLGPVQNRPLVCRGAPG